jgi:GDSL-like Lipase/Acylhydrolase family
MITTPITPELVRGAADLEITERGHRLGTSELRNGRPHISTFTGLGDEDKRIELWLPHNESLELTAIRSDAPLIRVQQSSRRWVHHGSSVSHGSNATKPKQTWTANAVRRGGVDLRNQGFGGGALVDPFIARVIRNAPAGLVSVKLGINVVNGDCMRLRAFVPVVHGFLDTIRDAHPSIPLFLISPILCEIHEDTPGLCATDPDTIRSDQVRFTATGDPYDVRTGRLTLRQIRSALASLVDRRANCTNLHYLDGPQLYGELDASSHPLPDGLHPDTSTHAIIAERFADYAFAADGPLAVRPLALPPSDVLRALAAPHR